MAGLLSDKLYGPPVKPPQPAVGLTAAFGGGIDWERLPKINLIVSTKTISMPDARIKETSRANTICARVGSAFITNVILASPLRA